MSMQEKRTVELEWTDVCGIISSEVEKILGVKPECKANVVEDEFWDVEFLDYHMPLPELCRLIQTIQPTLDDWVDALPDEGGISVNSISRFIAEKIIMQHLNITWEHSLITRDGLWLVGTSKRDIPCPTHGDDGCKFTDDLAQAITLIAERLYQ